jgi:phage gp16-like protein
MKPFSLIDSAQVKLLNTAISQLGLDKEDFKARFGVTSTKELTNAQFDQAMAHFKECGFEYKPLKKGGRGKKRYGSRGRPAYGQKSPAEHLQAIGKALETLGKPWAYAEGIARRMKFPVELKWCTAEQLHKVQVALIYKVRKLAGYPPEPRPETLAKRRARQAGEHVEP